MMPRFGIRVNRRARQSCEAVEDTGCVETKKILILDTMRGFEEKYQILEEGYQGLGQWRLSTVTLRRR